ncbi:hypothetical protein D0Z07_2318 [Hyphodiscus hymeniophilus]|uniref:Uncharacterized protein n=1 Tax=Hyphodiscus hymeniophilus TaxID=353542 RepID=A0A9P7AYK4_9HELO|nr:hypothetical protein D0Z07_2318 [Hyphodiscus hymeniophilus]
MFYHQSHGSSTLPRGFRYHHEEGDRPKTPEALTTYEPEQPSPPRPARLKVRRRNASSFQAPTDQFLASVAAADVPIPTIELPIDALTTEDLEMLDRESIFNPDSALLAPQTQDHRPFSPPKTPMPNFTFEETSQRPDWSMGTSSPDDYFKRSMSSLSNASDCSDDSFYSGSRVSRPSDDGSCTSPESEAEDPFTFPSISKGKGKAIYPDRSIEEVMILNKKIRSKTRKDAPWTKAMSNHLWSTYMLYVQDPTVTPFRIGASAMPPQGVIHRVARETKRSWKGPKVAPPEIRRPTRLSSSRGNSVEKSGSLTPTGEAPKVYTQWPHTSGATRNHLRDLCKSKNSIAVQSFHHLQSRSPTPFTKSHRQVRSEEPGRHSAFSTKDIVLSLTTSTAESMQPDGPLAQLAAEEPIATATPAFPLLEEFKPLNFGEPQGINEAQRNRRLGSPFLARTYGPSTSNNFNLGRPSPPRTQSDTTQPFLRSPLKFEPRSLNATMKRRAQHDLEEELSPNGAVLRPSILNEQLFGTAFQCNQRRVRSRGFSLGDEALANHVPGLFQRPALSTPSEVLADPIAGPSKTSPTLLPAASFDPPRLGSPFSESGPSQTFPRRLFQDGSATIRRSAFATMHQTRRSIESFDFGEGPSLQSRLQNLDQKLSEIRERGGAARRQNVE